VSRDDATAALADRMAGVLAEMDGARDPARFFLGTYLRTTLAVSEAIERGRFEDPPWVSSWVVDFADRYLGALTAARTGGGTVPRPWQRAFGADPSVRPEGHVLLGMNAHINYDLPLSLLALLSPADFADAVVCDRRRRDHERIDAVLAARVSAEDVALQRAGSRRTLLDRLAAPVNRTAARTLLKEARRKVWHNAALLDGARRAGPERLARATTALEQAADARVADLMRPGPVLLRLAVRGFGVTIPPQDDQVT
jgi:hypothetical protein